MDWSGFERLASSKDEYGVWIWAHQRHPGKAAEKVLAELRAEPDHLDDEGYGTEGG